MKIIKASGRTFASVSSSESSKGRKRSARTTDRRPRKISVAQTPRPSV